LAFSNHGLIDLFAQFLLQPVKRSLDFFRSSASLIDVGDPPLKIHPGLNGTQHLVAGSRLAAFILCSLVKSSWGQILNVHKIPDAWLSRTQLTKLPYKETFN